MKIFLRYTLELVFFMIACLAWLLIGFFLDTYIGEWAFNCFIIGTAVVGCFGFFS